MVKRFLTFAPVCFLFITKATAGFGDTTYFPQHISIDTLDRKDSLQVVAEAASVQLGIKDFVLDNGLATTVDLSQLNPLVVDFVQDYIEKNGKSLTPMKDWGKPYFDMMDEVFEAGGIPKEMKYLAVIESQLKSGAKSWAGAVGPWQFMAGTARNMGLKVTRKTDERRNFLKSTQAASKYLTSLYAMYEDWLLVIAAYNGGPGKVNSAIQKSGSRDFWKLQAYLPAESRNHVKKFIATHYLMEGQGGITTSSKLDESYFVIQNNSDSTIRMETITGRYNSGLMIAHLNMDRSKFNDINPGFDKKIAMESKYDLRLPVDKMDVFQQKKAQILNESMMLLLNGDVSRR